MMSSIQLVFYQTVDLLQVYFVLDYLLQRNGCCFDREIGNNGTLFVGQVIKYSLRLKCFYRQSSNKPPEGLFAKMNFSRVGIFEGGGGLFQSLVFSSKVNIKTT